MTLTGLAFALAFFACLALAVVRSPIYGLYAYVAVFYLHPPSRWWGASLPDLRWSLLAAFVTLILIMRRPGTPGRPAWYKTTGAKVLIAYTVWLWVQNLWALDPEENMAASILFSKYVVLYFLFYRLVETPRELRRVLLVHIAGCFYLGWLAIGAYDGGRLEGVGGPGIDEANAFAMQLATGAVAASMVLLTGSKLEKLFCLAALPFILNGIVLAGSRGAFLAMIVGAVVLTFLKPPQYKKLFYTFAVLGVTLFAIVASASFWERIGTMKAAVDENETMDTSAESRLAIAAAQWRMTLRYPFGSGHRGTVVLSRQYIEEKYLSKPTADAIPSRASHNTFMTCLSEQGFLGALLFISLWRWCASTSRRLSKTARGQWPAWECADLAGVAAALAVIFIAGMFVDYLKAEIQVWMVALLASCSTMAHAESARELHPAGATHSRSPAVTRQGLTG